MAILKKYSWEVTLFCLVIIEILGFGMINPRMLDLNVLVILFISACSHYHLP